MKLNKKIISVALLTSIIVSNMGATNSYATSENSNEKYEKNKIQIPKSYSYSQNIDLSEDEIDDLSALWNISYLKTKTDSKYEIALAYENGDYTYVGSAETIEDAITIAKNKAKSIEDNIVPSVIDENGLVVYTTEGIGKVVKIINGKPVSITDTTRTVKVYKNANDSNEYTSINHAFVDDVPILDDNGKRVKIQVNGLIGWIDKEDSTGVNIISVPINQAKNLSYYKNTSAGSLQHYISYDVETTNAGNVKTVGVAPNFMDVNKKYYSYDGNYFYTNINTLISDMKNNTTANAVNKNNPYYNYFTYLSGRSKSSYYTKELENYIQNNTSSDSVLRGQAINFVKAQNKYGVNASFMLAIAMNESNKGISNMAKTKNNIFGIKAYDSNSDAATKFDSVEDCINRFASHYMSNLYLNPNYNLHSGSNLGNKGVGINVRYATDPFWGEKAAEFMYEIDRYVSGNGSLIEYNKNQLAIYKSTNEVKDSNGNTLYKILTNRSKSAQVGDPVILLSQSLNKYNIYADRQYPTNVTNPNPGSYDWSKTAYINTSGVEKINTKQSNPRINTNNKPTITTSNTTISLGSKLDLLEGVSSSDTEDGNLKSEISVKSSNVNTSKLGSYKVVYSVTDSDNNTVTKERSITVNNVFTNFTVNNIDNKTTTIKGKGVSGSTVKAYVGSKQIGSTTTVNSSGNYSITIPVQSANTKIKVQISKSGYVTSSKTITVIGVTSGAKKSLTTDIYKYDAGKGKYLTYINGRGYSQYVYLNKSGKYAFTPSSWMVAAGLDVSMPKASNGYTMTIDNNYIQMYNEANELLNNIKSGKIATTSIEEGLNKIRSIKNQETEVQNESKIMTKATSKKTLTADIYKYDIGKGKHLTYINGKGYSQYVYLNKSGNYAFTPSSWMVAAGLTVTMPTSSNGYTMKITNPYITKYNNVVKQIESYR